MCIFFLRRRGAVWTHIVIVTSTGSGLLLDLHHGGGKQQQQLCFAERIHETRGQCTARPAAHLWHVGKTRKEVYKALWASLMFVAKLATGGKRTLVYPKVLREAVRERFGDPKSGAYDDQYEEEETTYHVTMEDLVAAKWRAPPKNCKLCSV